MLELWFGASLLTILFTILKTAGIYVSVVLFTRLYGLRSFAKISGFDFAMTVAVGSAIATTMMTPDPPLLRATIAIFTLYGLQKLVSRLRRSAQVEQYIDNQPLLIVENGQIRRDALDRADLTELDLRAQLRQSNISRLEDVRAVVLEMTGDVSVISHQETHDDAFDDWILDGVQGAGEASSSASDTRQGEHSSG